MIGAGIILVGIYMVLRSLLEADKNEGDNIKIQIVWSIGLVIIGSGIGYIVGILI